jgi:hypothetical protein
VQLVGDLDDTARVHHVVGRVQDVAVGQVLLDARVGQLVVGGAAHDLGGEHRHGVVVQRAAQRAGGVDAEPVDADQRLGVRDGQHGVVPLGHLPYGLLAHVGHEDLGALRDQVLHQVAADLADARDADAPGPQRGVAPQMLGAGPHALVDAVRGEDGGVAGAAVLG